MKIKDYAQRAVTGTDGYHHGVCFGAKDLENKTKKKPVLCVSDAAHYSGRRLSDLQKLGQHRTIRLRHLLENLCPDFVTFS